MTLRLNGLEITSGATTLAELLDQQSIETKGIAVAINRRVVPRAEWSVRVICEGDEIVIVSAVYGG
ncbi:MAG: sulfur carrier protein ThiS [Rikenellaceae bacterium]